mgnify:CR=1 FL=1
MNKKWMMAAALTAAGVVTVQVQAQEVVRIGHAAAVTGPVLLGLDVLAAGERKDFGFPDDITLDSYVLANLTAQWQVNAAFALIARVENLLDEDYELASTFNTPVRGIYVAMRYAPGRKEN